MAFDDPQAVTGLSVSALEGRRGIAAQLVHSDDALSATPGVLNGFACSVATLTLTVGVGAAVLSPSVGANGSYLAVNNASMTAAFTAQDATYARIDRVVLRVYDNEVDASGQSKAAVEIIAGTPSAAPVAPTLPAGRLEIYQAQVPKSGTGSITLVDKRLYTASAGGVIVAQSYATLPTGSWLRYGQKAFTIDYLVPWRWNGTAWIVDGVPTFTSTGNRDAGIPSPAAGTRAIVGAGTPLEYLYTGTAWRVWSGDVSSLITAATNWRLDRIHAAVSAGQLTVSFAAARLTGNYGPAGIDTADAILNLDSSIRPAPGSTDFTVGPAWGSVTSGTRWGSFGLLMGTSTIKLRFEAASGPYIALNAAVHGTATWRIA